MDLSAVGQDQKFQDNCSWSGMCEHMARYCRKRAEHNNQDSQSSGWSGTGNQSKSNPGTGEGKGESVKGKEKGKDKIKAKIMAKKRKGRIS